MASTDSFYKESLIAALVACFLAGGLFFYGGCARKQKAASPDLMPPRIVSLAPSITEIICALGAEKMLVGRTSACDYPAEIVKNIPVVGGFGVPSMEALLHTRPTIVLGVALEDEAIAAVIKNCGIRYLRVSCSRLDDIPRAMKEIGHVVGQEPRAGELAKKFERRMAELRLAADKSGATNKPAVFAEIWSDPLMTAGAGSLVDELISLAGGRNIGAFVAREYFAVSPEWVVAQDPEIIICLDLADAKSVAGRAGWSKIKAVRTGRVHCALNNDAILRSGPRVLEGAAVLRECISGKKLP